jgi:hypothetical protein
LIKASAAPRAILDAAIVRLALTEKFADVTAVAAGLGNGDGAMVGAGAGSKKR